MSERILPLGCPGELCLVGQQLAEGYRIELVGIEAVMGHTEGIKKGSVNISGA